MLAVETGVLCVLLLMAMYVGCQGNDPVAMLRWAIVRAFFRAYFAFKNGGKKQGLTVAKGNAR